jgi:hypothetical protein
MFSRGSDRRGPTDNFVLWLLAKTFSNRVIPEATAKTLTRPISWLVGDREDLPSHLRPLS